MSTPIPDGGPAFPTEAEPFLDGPQGKQPASAWGMQGSPGMSLRDYFEGKALVGILSNPNVNPLECGDKQIAELCRFFANSLLSARNQTTT